MEIILASQSPRRRELMDLLKIDYTVMPSGADETFEEGLAITEQSKRLRQEHMQYKVNFVFL